MILETIYKTYKLKLVYEFIRPSSNVIRIKKVINENGNDIFGKCTSETLQRLRQLVKNELNS
tara:strand:+ start:82 stop:267 length:186 start_codon:yes stop_codon:yes gene_type:complete